MQSRSRLFDDAAKLAGSAIGTLDGIRRELEGLARQQVERILNRMDLVAREEFDAVKAMAAKAREQQDALEARIDALEAQLAAGKRAPRKVPRKAAGGAKGAKKSTGGGKPRTS